MKITIHYKELSFRAERGISCFTSLFLRSFAALCLCCFTALPLCHSGTLPLSSPLPIQWFYTEGCRKCAEVKLLLDKIERVHAGQIIVERLDIMAPENYERMMALERQYGVKESVPMEIFVGDQYLLGHDRILRGLEKTVAAVLSSAPRQMEGRASSRPSNIHPPLSFSSSPAILSRLRPFAVASAGLIDGVNPCAFATVVFLVSLLLGRNFTRSQILGAGLSFAAAVFAAYFLIGLGAFRVVYRLNAFPLVSSAVFWGIAAAVIGLGIWSLKDAVIYHRTGQAASITLAMPARIRARLHSVLRAQIRPVRIGAACFAAGMAVSVLELVCTGQIYFPTIMMLAGVPSTRWAALGYLALYNIMFILPLLVVLGLCLAGVKLAKFMPWSRKSVVAVKLALAVLFFGLGAALIAPRILPAFAIMQEKQLP